MDINLFIASDGSEHPTMESCNKANERYWEAIVTKNEEFSKINGEKIEINPDIQIKYYQNTINYLMTEKLFFSTWFEHYNLLTKKVAKNTISPELAVLYAQALLGSFVVKTSIQDERNHIELCRNLIALINEFKSNNKNVTR